MDCSVVQGDEVSNCIIVGLWANKLYTRYWQSKEEKQTVEQNTQSCIIDEMILNL